MNPVKWLKDAWTYLRWPVITLRRAYVKRQERKKDKTDE